MMSLFCFQSQPSESAGNRQTTLENPPDVTLDHIVKKLLSFFDCDDFHKDTKEIQEKCNIEKVHGDCWSADDIKQAWGETQIMDKKSRRGRHWARVIMLQVLTRCLYYGGGFNRIEEQSDLRKVETPPKLFDDAAEITPSETEQVPSEIPSPSETRNKMDTKANRKDDSNTITTIKKEECLEPSDQSFQSIYPAGGSSQSSAELQITEKLKKMMVQPIPGADSSGYQHGATKVSVNAGSDSLPSFFTEIASREEATNENICQRTRSKKRTYLNRSSSQTVYIRIPFSVMSGDESTCKPEVVNDNPTYKLIDRVPNLTEIRKKKSYAMLYDNRTRNAAWVYEILNTSTLGKHNLYKSFSEKFHVDDSIHPFFQTKRAINLDSKTYDRGHLAAAANHQWCEKANDDTYVLSNMTIQNSYLNQNMWKNFEQELRNKIKNNDNIRNIHVYTGPLYLPECANNTWPDDLVNENLNVPYLRRKDKAVPTHFFKVVIEEKRDDTVEHEETDDTVELKSYIVPNRKLTGEMKDYKIPIEYIEKYSGLIFTESLCNQEESVSLKTVTWHGEDKDGKAESNVRVKQQDADVKRVTQSCV